MTAAPGTLAAQKAASAYRCPDREAGAVVEAGHVTVNHTLRCPRRARQDRTARTGGAR